jgi:hypothetical protein
MQKDVIKIFAIKLHITDSLMNNFCKWSCSQKMAKEKYSIFKDFKIKNVKNFLYSN